MRFSSTWRGIEMIEMAARKACDLTINTGIIRKNLRLAVVLPLVMGAAGCQVLDLGEEKQATDLTAVSNIRPSDNPVIVDNVVRTDRFAKLAATQHPKILATYGGEYSDPRLERMIAKAIGRLTISTDDPNQTFQITILNSPNVNAFALPGGYVYVTRGLLALANDSAELAAVIAHEMAHVTAKHGVARQKREADANLASRVVSEALQDNETGKQALIRSKLSLAQFSRNQELEADAIGIKALGRSGYDPFAASRFLSSLGAYTDFRAANTADDMSLDFLATHPAAPQRVELAKNHARLFGAPGIGETDREAYLTGIEGLLFGDSPKEGFARGQEFMHPGLGIKFKVPQGYTIENNKDAVLAAGPGEFAIRFDGVEVPQNVSLTDYVKSGWVTGLIDATVIPATINGVEAAMGTAQAERWQFHITVLRVKGRVYRFLTAAPAGAKGVADVATSITSTFTAMSEAERLSLKPTRVRIVTVKAGDTVGSLSARMVGTDRPQELFRLINGLAAGQSVSVGERVKIVTDLPG
jgi:predicted Zn-dependent protease